jgi:transposase InsO family protein
MSWNAQTTMSLRLEFVNLARSEDANIAELCRRFVISRQTAYKWIERFEEGGVEALQDRSRRPHSMPERTDAEMTARIVELRQKHPSWGPRKLRRRLQDLGVEGLPAPSTIGGLLRREGLIAPEAALGHRPHQRFARSEPNALWQIDFKGHFALARGGRCHPLTALDDCTRYLLALVACANQRDAATRAHLTTAFRRYGLPLEILADNAPPWGSTACDGGWTAFGVWLLRLGVRLIHGRARHPQTQGKEERFHRTLQADLLSRRDFADLSQTQHAFDQYRPHYNCERPHQALDLSVPASHYHASARSFPERLPSIEYAPGDLVKTVKAKGEITWKNRTYFIGNAFVRQPVALRPTRRDGVLEVFFCHQKLGIIDLHLPPAPSKHHYLSIRPQPHS